MYIHYGIPKCMYTLNVPPYGSNALKMVLSKPKHVTKKLKNYGCVKTE